jgi:L-threonylcarbamoyladenylate synthase
MSACDTRLEAVLEALGRGGVVGVPTDTVYGIACRPDDPAALERVYAIKRRPAGLEVGLLGAEAADLEPLVTMTSGARRLAAAFWPGGLSLVLPIRLAHDPRPRSRAAKGAAPADRSARRHQRQSPR